MASKTNDRIITTGATNPHGSASPPERKEINDLIHNDPIGFSLYARALARMKKTDQNWDASYYQISGIHGEPYIAWQGAGGNKPATPSRGYCAHSSVIFPTWHRPYVALYEQILVKHAQDVAAGMPPDWQRKAEELRLPYWDWARTLEPPSAIMKGTHLHILKPGGHAETIENPFLNYAFDPIPEFSPGRSPVTYRNPVFTKRIANFVRSHTLRILNRANSWHAMSNDSVVSHPHPQLAPSLEQIHNVIHNQTGGFMGDPALAAFDPIFWMHHANVDRLLAIWQAIHPRFWVIPSVITAKNGTWNLGVGDKIDATTPLEPFWDSDDSNSYWSSNESRVINSLGYTYPELKDHPSPLKLMREMERLYGQKSVNAYTKAAAGVRAGSSEAATLHAVAASLAEANFADILPDVQLPEGELGTTARGILGTIAPAFLTIHEESSEAASADEDVQVSANAQNTSLHDWAVRVNVEKYALKSSFDVVIFLLPPEDPNPAISETDSSSWFESPYYVGSVSAFVNSRAEHCANCQNAIAQNLHIEGFVSLNEAIIEISNLRSFDDSVVHPYLKDKLVWKVRKVLDGSIVPNEEISSLEVSVWSAPLLRVPEAGPLPVFGDSKRHHSITADVPGGSRSTADQ